MKGLHSKKKVTFSSSYIKSVLKEICILSVQCSKKYIQDVSLDCVPALRIVKKWFCRFRNGDFNLNNEIHSGRSFGIDNDLFHSLENNNPQITIEEIG